MNIKQLLEDRIINNVWEWDNEKIRAIFTTLCIMERLDDETILSYLKELYDKSGMLESDISYMYFTDYMLKIINS